MMSLFAVVLALILEQLRPLGSRNKSMVLYTRFANRVEKAMNAGEYRHGVMAWLTAVLPLVLPLLGLWWWLRSAHWGWALLLELVVLYLTLGFRQFSFAYSGINQALQAGDLPEARRVLHEWTNLSTSELSAHEVARVAIEQGLIEAYRHMFGTLFWFGILGPMGAVLFRLTTTLYHKWGVREEQLGESFGRFTRQIMAIMDWVPIRLTALSFALIGNFQDAWECWHNQADKWMHHDGGILLASAAGALGLRLGRALHQDHTVVFRPELGLGEEVEPSYMHNAAGLAWRAVVLWLVMWLLLTLALTSGYIQFWFKHW